MGTLAAALAVLVSTSAAVSYSRGLEEAPRIAEGHRLAAFYLATYRTEPDFLLEGVYPDARRVRRLAPVLERLGYTVFSSRSSPLPPPLESLRAVPSASACTIDEVNGVVVSRSRGSFVLQGHVRSLGLDGWCVDEQAKARAGGVYMLLDGRAYPAFYGTRRIDVAAFFRRPEYERSGFFRVIELPRLRPGRHSLSVVAVSHDRRRSFAPANPVVFRVRTV